METKNRDEIEESFSRLWHEYEPYIRKLCAYKTASMPRHTDDCVQDVFKALLTAMKSGTEIEYPKAWLTKVAGNKIKNLYSRAKREAEISDLLTDRLSEAYRLNEAFDPEKISEEKVEERLEEIIGSLTCYEKELFEDRYVAHKKEKEMAFERGVTENLIQQQVFRLKRKIIKKLRQYETS